MNGLILFDTTAERMTETMPLTPRQQLLLHYDDKESTKPMRAVKRPV